MTTCRCYIVAQDVPATCPPDELHVLLFAGSPPHPHTAAIGNQLRDLLLRLGVQPSARSVDLLSIALAVTAADSFVPRDQADDGWGRELKIIVPVRDVAPWLSVRTTLEALLSFLSGDTWSFEFVTGGEEPPALAAIRSHQRRVDLSAGDLVSLFSGGLDSSISTIELLAQGGRPILVSHAYTGDQTVQTNVASALPVAVPHASVNVWPTSDLASEISMRSRSFLFLAIAAMVADCKSKLKGGGPIELRVPENGLIALNAPLTPRRLGSHSTRTTHPHYLALLQTLFDNVGIAAVLNNPFELLTKGEMVGRFQGDPTFIKIASGTVSCGKWKRKSQQCGRCVPCLIRRASLYAGDVEDRSGYQNELLKDVLDDEELRDDLVAMLTATRRVHTDDLNRWVARSGPLPLDPARRAGLVDVHRRGLLEVETFLQDSGL